MEQQLIALYPRVCRVYDQHPTLKYQRLLNFRPRFTDEQLLTIYLFGHMQGCQQQRRIYDYTRRHWRRWFPRLPSYQAFNRRLNRLVPAFEQFITEMLAGQVTQLATRCARLIDSRPIILATWPRSGTAKVARGVADQGFSASMRSYYYGVKLHALALRRTRELPLPALLHLSRASQHDLSALR